MASKYGKLGFKFSEPCPDCARLRALLWEAHAKLIVFPVLTRNPKLSGETADLAARIAKELEVKI